MTVAALFDAARTLKRELTGKGLTQEEVDAFNAVIGRWSPLTVSDEGLRLIRSFEGYAKPRPDGGCEAYPDPASGGDPWTIGFGSTGSDIKRGTVWTRAQAEQRFADHVAEFAGGVIRLLDGAPTSQNEFDALVSLAYNIGLGNFGSSTLLRMHKRGFKVDAAAQFVRWNRAAGRVMAGLTRRREAEAAHYRGEPWE